MGQIRCCLSQYCWRVASALCHSDLACVRPCVVAYWKCVRLYAVCPACDSSWLFNCETTNRSFSSSFIPKHSALVHHAPCTQLQSPRLSPVTESPEITTAACPCRDCPRRTWRVETWAGRGRTWSRCRRRWEAPPGSRPRGRGCPTCPSRRRLRARAPRCPSAC